VVVGDPSERSRRYQQTDLAELRISRADVPALTITADPGLSVAVTGSERPDWSLRFCAQGRGGSDEEARERLREISMVRTGATVSLIAPHLGGGYYRGDLIVEAPAEAPLTIHASYAAVRLRDMKGPVRITASHARAQILDTVGQVDAVALVIDYSTSRGEATLSADQINLKLPTTRFEGRLQAAAQQSVKMLVPPGFLTPFRAIVQRRRDFVCRTDFSSRIVHEEVRTAHYFTYAGDNGSTPDDRMLLHSEHSTVVIDTHRPRRSV